jgi:hypothetical protein
VLVMFVGCCGRFIGPVGALTIVSLSTGSGEGLSDRYRTAVDSATRIRIVPATPATQLCEDVSVGRDGRTSRRSTTGDTA